MKSNSNYIIEGSFNKYNFLLFSQPIICMRDIQYIKSLNIFDWRATNLYLWVTFNNKRVALQSSAIPIICMIDMSIYHTGNWLLWQSMKKFPLFIECQLIHIIGCTSVKKFTFIYWMDLITYNWLTSVKEQPIIYMRDIQYE